MNIKKCLIGYSGTIGTALLKQTKFHYIFNSKNISKIKNQKYDIVVCCAANGSMIKANKNPKDDLKNIKKLISNIKNIKTKHFILISTIQVFDNITHKNYVFQRVENTDFDRKAPIYNIYRVLIFSFIFSNICIQMDLNT